MDMAVGPLKQLPDGTYRYGYPGQYVIIEPEVLELALKELAENGDQYLTLVENEALTETLKEWHQPKEKQ